MRPPCSCTVRNMSCVVAPSVVSTVASSSAIAPATSEAALTGSQSSFRMGGL